MIHFLTALSCEAQPLKAKYHLSRLMTEDAFDVYRNDDITLSVTGVGKTSMAAATAYTHVLFGKHIPSVWLNIGIAGHATHQVGSGFIIHKIIDQDRGKQWYPPLVYRPPCPTESLRTVSSPEFEYAQLELYDMEASGFYETATRFAPGELVQCLKVVSDNSDSPATALRPKQVSALIEQQLEKIDLLLSLQRELAGILHQTNPDLLCAITQQWRFSADQKRQLRVLLNRWCVLVPNQDLNLEGQSSLTNASEVIRWLRGLVDQLPVKL